MKRGAGPPLVQRRSIHAFRPGKERTQARAHDARPEQTGRRRAAVSPRTQRGLRRNDYQPPPLPELDELELDELDELELELECPLELLLLLLLELLEVVPLLELLEPVPLLLLLLLLLDVTIPPELEELEPVPEPLLLLDELPPPEPELLELDALVLPVVDPVLSDEQPAKEAATTRIGKRATRAICFMRYNQSHYSPVGKAE